MLLTSAELAATVDTLAAAQGPGGMIPWFEGGHADAWNHVQAAMALTAGGRREEADRAFAWLAATQRPDGAWHQYYRGDGSVEVALLDANVTAYVACGLWHHHAATGDRSLLEGTWPMLEAAMGFVLGLARPSGEIAWARHPDGTPWSFALLTASASTYRSLRSALRIAGALGRERPAWAAAARRLRRAVAEERPGTFCPKDRWSMDWYYPVLAGVVRGPAARRRLARDRDRFALGGLGIRCVADQPWVTAAETAECAMAHALAGDEATARALLGSTRRLRHPDGSYFTGDVHPGGTHFPGGERSTYSAATVVLAHDLLASPSSPTRRLLVEASPSLVEPVPAPALVTARPRGPGA